LSDKGKEGYFSISPVFTKIRLDFKLMDAVGINGLYVLTGLR
jgi:hypothetical protein